MSTGLAGNIDSLLRSRGSPMAGLGNVFVSMGRKYGVDPRLLVGISGIESGFGVHTMGNHNAWGWGPGKPFASWEEGISTVAQGLRSGYLNQGLTSPYEIANKYAPASDGNDPQNWANVVSGFITQLGGSPQNVRVVGGGAHPASTSPPSSTISQPSSQQVPKTPLPAGYFAQQAMMGSLGQIASYGHVNPLSQLQDLSQGLMSDALYGTFNQPQTNADQTPQPLHAGPNRHPQTGPRSFQANGDPVPSRYLSSVGGEHPTMGLAGFPAHDYMAPSGSPAVAPVSGRVIRLSGHDPAQGPTQGPHGPFGWSVYIQGSDGHTYYLTHMGSRSVQVGQRVQAGQRIGTVGDYAKYGTPSHIHMGVH